MAFEDIIYEKRNGVARISINRPEKLNSFRGKTVEELISALNDAGWDKSIGVIVLGATGDRAFCTGGDQTAHDGFYDGRGTIGMPMEELHSIMRDIPKPIIARVQGYSIGGGNVLVTICDLAIASEKASFGQAGPRVGSVDPGWGTAYLAHAIGEKKAREIWYLCRRYSAQEALQMGLCNAVVATTNSTRKSTSGVPKFLRRAQRRSRLPRNPSTRGPNIFAESLRWVCRPSHFSIRRRNRKRV